MRTRTGYTCVNQWLPGDKLAQNDAELALDGSA